MKINLSTLIAILASMLYLIVYFIPDMGGSDVMGAQWLYASSLSLAILGYIGIRYTTYVEAISQVFLYKFTLVFSLLLFWARSAPKNNNKTQRYCENFENTIDNRFFTQAECFDYATEKIIEQPLFYAFDDDIKRYPRYFNTPNQEHLAKKIAALEHAEAAMIFSSGMAGKTVSFSCWVGGSVRVPNL